MPVVRPLQNKPLVEAIFELRWQVSAEQGDPHYPLFVGRLYDRVQSQYPYHEPLPAALVPIPIAQNIVQHRFRVNKDHWPLIQDLPAMPEGFDGWVEAAHRLTDDWFFKFIAGELERRFAGE